MSPRLRIGYVIWSLGLGGAEQVMMRLASESSRRGHEVTIFTLNAPGVFARRMQAQGVPVVSVGKRSRHDITVVSRLAREFATRRLDIVHTHLWGANLWGRLAARRARVPVVVATEHNVDTWKRAHHFVIDRFLARWTTQLIAVSHEVRHFYESHGIGLGRWRVIYNGIATTEAPPRQRGAVYAALGIGPHEPVVGWVGRLVPSKAPMVFLEAIAIASREVPSLKALVVGEGSLREEVDAQIHQRGLEGRVICTGLRQDVPELLVGMDVLVFSSEREGLSMAMLEAMAAGVPVVATAVGGTPELIEQGITGLLVRPAHPEELAAGLVGLLRDPARADAIRQAARKRVEQQFSLRHMIEAHEKLYEEGAGGGRQGARETSTPRPVKVAYIIDHLDVGGAQRQLVELATRLPRDAWELVVISLSDSQRTLAEELVRAGIPVHRIPQRGAVDVLCLWRLSRLLRAYRPSIVHTFLFTADTYGRLAARLTGVRRVICAIRNTIEDMPWHHRLVNRWLTRWTSCVTVNADAIRPGLIREGGVPERKLRTVYNGIDFSASPAAHRNGVYRREWNIPERARIVAMIARLAPQKDHRTFLEAASLIARTAPHVYFVLVGDGPRRPDVERWIGELGLAAKTRVLGERRDVRQLLESVDVCVLATHYEGCSNTVMEAMAAGKPVVATRVGGNPELIVEGETGLLVPPKDAEALAQAIARLVQDEKTLWAMGERGRARIAERFTLEVALAQTQALYHELLNDRMSHTHVG